jgi:hypothetical protein
VIRSLGRALERGRVPILIVAGVIVLAELGTRGLAPHLPEPLLWTDESTQVKVAQMDRIADGPGCVDVAFVGNSMTRDAIDPETFTAADPEDRSAYNAALDAATPALLERWALDEVEPRVDPATVVVGLSSFDLNDNARIGATALDRYDAATLSRDDVFGRLQAPLVEHSDLFRYRAELRQPRVLWESLGRLRRGEEEPRLSADGVEGVIGPDGEGLSRRELTYVSAISLQRFAQTELLNDFRVGGRQTEAAGDLLQGLADRGVETVVVALPVTQDYVGLHPEGEADFQDFLTVAERVAGESGATFVDAHDWAASTEQFADTHHLNGEGALAFSADLPTLMTAAGAGAPTCGG